MKNKKINLETKNTNTWCPGCPNFMILNSSKNAFENLISNGKYKHEDFVIVTDIGCNGKIYDYINVSGFNALHGRILPTGFGIKVGNPKLKVVCYGGDGGTYNEGLDHFIHCCRYNVDMTLVVHNNQIFSLTAGQSTASTEPGFVEKTHPFGVKEKTLNPLVLALESGATFVARVSVFDIPEMTKVLEQAIQHKGFSFVEILQPCIVFHDFSKFLKSSTYQISEMALDKALEEAKKWDYSHDKHEESKEKKIAVGIFYRKQEPTFEDRNLSWKLK